MFNNPCVARESIMRVEFASRDIEACLPTQLDAVERDAFSTLYNRLSPLLFGIISRIAQCDATAEDALQAVFLCMHERGLARLSRPWPIHVLMPIVFSCVERTLRDTLPADVVAARIAAERERMLRGAR